MNSISAILNIMIKAAEKASKGLIRDFGEVEKLQVSMKGPSNFVSNADKKAEKIIIEELSKSRKKYSIIGEETGIINNSDIFVYNSSLYFLIFWGVHLLAQAGSSLGLLYALPC